MNQLVHSRGRQTYLHYNMYGMYKINSFLILILLSGLSLFSQESELLIPEMKDQQAAAGLRVKVTAPEYIGTEVHHSLYLPGDWEHGNKYPVIVEYTGNYYPESGSTGKVEDANLGYGLTGGIGFIWIVMPYIAEDLNRNERTWWGNIEASINYCKVNLPRICQAYGGDTNNIFICGFSRGAIAVNYLGLADDEIARFWKGFIAHEHYDGVRTWGYEDDNGASALSRLGRLNGRPQLISEAATFNLSGKAREYLANHSDLGNFTFLTVPVDSLFNIPEEIPISHTDLWPIKNSPARCLAREWLWDKIDMTNF